MRSRYLEGDIAKALTAISRFCRWAVDEGWLRRNPVSHVERPTVVAMSPRELDDDQRYVLKTLIEMSESKRLGAIFALGYWAGLRIGEVATLKMERCDVNQRAGVVNSTNCAPKYFGIRTHP